MKLDAPLKHTTHSAEPKGHSVTQRKTNTQHNATETHQQDPDAPGHTHGATKKTKRKQNGQANHPSPVPSAEWSLLGWPSPTPCVKLAEKDQRHMEQRCDQSAGGSDDAACV